jgi:hypothetical protein
MGRLIIKCEPSTRSRYIFGDVRLFLGDFGAANKGGLTPKSGKLSPGNRKLTRRTCWDPWPPGGEFDGFMGRKIRVHDLFLQEDFNGIMIHH